MLASGPKIGGLLKCTLGIWKCTVDFTRSLAIVERARHALSAKEEVTKQLI